MSNRNKRFSAVIRTAFPAAVIIAAVAVTAGCAGMIAESRFKEEATAKYVFNIPAEKLLDETVAYLSGGAVGAALTGGASMSAMENLTAAGPWKAGKLLRSRISTKITKVDDNHSTLVMNNETQTFDSDKGGWVNSTYSRSAAYELQMIKRLDRQAAAEIEAGAKKAAREAKKK